MQGAAGGGGERGGSGRALRSRSSHGPPSFPSADNRAEGGHDKGRLYLVSTPIGNLADITYRAVEILSTVTLIVAEDTRHSRTLLDHHAIKTPSTSYHEHNEARETPRLIAKLLAGQSIALISDAGTPLISDPGSRLVQAAVTAGVPIVPIPGPSALLAALVASGLSADRFTFYGFLPRKGKERTQTLTSIIHSSITSVVYEAANRVKDTLQDLSDSGAPDRQAVVARELTKKFEDIRRGTVTGLAQQIGEELKGEVVIIVEGAPDRDVDEETLRTHLAELRAAGVTTREMVDRLMTAFGVARNVAYRLVHEHSAH